MASKGKNFMLTMNNPAMNKGEFMDWLTACGKQKVQYARFQLEKGEKGTPHYQACIGFKSDVRLKAAIKMFPGCHVEVTRNAQAAWKYCGKEDTRADKENEPACYGIPPAAKNVKGGVKEKNEMILFGKGLRQAILDGDVPLKVAAQYQRGINVFYAEGRKAETLSVLEHEWHWGSTGAGKSRPIREKHPDAYIKMANKWWCGYRDEEVVILEDLGKDQIAPHHLKVWADHYPVTVEAKGFTLGKIRPKKIYITSNWRIRELYKDPQDYEPLERRFKEVHHVDSPFIILKKQVAEIEKKMSLL